MPTTVLGSLSVVSGFFFLELSEACAAWPLGGFVIDKNVDVFL